MSQPSLQYPDFSREFILTTDVSNEGAGAVMSHGQTGKDLPIAYANRKFNKAERNYSTVEKELAAIVWGIKHFRPYLYGRKFKIMSDHQPVTRIMSVRDPGSRLLRWRIQLDEYDYEIVYKPGVQNSNADALSRINTLAEEGRSGYEGQNSTREPRLSSRWPSRYEQNLRGHKGALSMAEYEKGGRRVR
jgi:hypothetical protein